MNFSREFARFSLIALAMAENFFSILKTECIYRHKPNSFNEANALIERYIHFYNHERMALSTISSE